MLTGMNIRKEKSWAAFGVKPLNIPTLKVTPLREIPGNSERSWIIPIFKASKRFIFFPERLFLRYPNLWSNNINIAVTSNEHPTNFGSWNNVSILSMNK